MGSGRGQFLLSMHRLRGVAIIMVVTGHALYPSTWEPDSFLGRVVANLLQGGTHIFVFVAGFLFHHTVSGRFRFGAYLERKLSNVISPYLVLSAIAIALRLSPWFDARTVEVFVRPEWGWFGRWVWPALCCLLTGDHMGGYWFIPFISLVYLLAPVFLEFGRARSSVQLLISTCALAVSLFAWRPVSAGDIPHALVYFTFPYLLGIMWSVHRDSLRLLLQGREWVPILLAFTCAAAQAVFYDKQGNLTKDLFAAGWPDITLCQKAFLSIGLLAVLDRLDDLALGLLDSLAEASFAVYFMHGFVRFAAKLVIGRPDLHAGIIWLLYSAGMIAGSYAAAWILKNVSGRHSRMVIGW